MAQDTLSQLSRMLDGELSAAEEADLLKTLETSADARSQYREICQLHAALAFDSDETLRELAQPRALPQPATKKPLISVWALGAAAAVLVVLLGIGLFPQGNTPGPRDKEGATLAGGISNSKSQKSPENSNGVHLATYNAEMAALTSVSYTHLTLPTRS